MPGFKTVSQLTTSEEDGRAVYSTWRKSPNQSTTGGVWFDLSMSPGNPLAQYYPATPLTAIGLAQSTDGGLFHGGGVDPRTKHLRNILAMSTSSTPLPMPMMLLDYLMFYPFIDESNIASQDLITNISLPRYPSGDGVQIMAVSVAARSGGSRFFVEYTNSLGVPNRISETVLQNSVSVIGSLVTSGGTALGNAGPFIPLQQGDTGVRSINKVTMLTPDFGLFTLVLVKPLGQMQILGVDAPVEIDYFKDFSQCPIVKNDAYLNFITCPAGSLAGTSIHGDIKLIWN